MPITETGIMSSLRPINQGNRVKHKLSQFRTVVCLQKCRHVDQYVNLLFD